MFKSYFVYTKRGIKIATQLSVKDFFSKGYKSVTEDDYLSKCWNLFKQTKPPVLVVFSENGEYKGVIARRTVIRSRLDFTSTKVKNLTRSAPKININFSLSKTAKLMIESGIRQLPVFEKNKLIGFITDEKIIQGVIVSKWGNTELSKVMTKTPFTIEASRSIGALLNLMREKGISHLPITDKGKVVGIVSIQDLLEHVFQPKHRQSKGETIGKKVPLVNIPIRGLMKNPVITAFPEMKIKDAIMKMNKNNISCLVIVKNGELTGIATKIDFLEPISQMETAERRLRVQFAVKGIKINPDQKILMMNEFNSFIHKYEEGLEAGTLFVYIKTHGKSHKGIPLIHCRLQLKTVKGAFFSSGEGYGVEFTFQIAMERLDRRLLRSKELNHNPKFARDFLQEISFT